MRIVNEELLQSMNVRALWDIAREYNIRSASTMKRVEVVQKILAIAEGREQLPPPIKRGAPKKRTKSDLIKKAPTFQECPFADCGDKNTISGLVEGYFKMEKDGSGFVHVADYFPKANNVYVDRETVFTNLLKDGDKLVGFAKRLQEDVLWSLQSISTINGLENFKETPRPHFEDFSVEYVNKSFNFSLNSCDTTLRYLDLLVPMGFGQRAIIASLKKAGKSTMLKKIATAINGNFENVKSILTVVDETDEEVNAYKKITTEQPLKLETTIEPTRLLSAFNIMIERAKRIAEEGNDVVLYIEGLHKILKIYKDAKKEDANIERFVKQLFYTARNFENCGSLTIIATMEIADENNEDYQLIKDVVSSKVLLKAEYSKLRIFPAVNFNESETTNEQLIFDERQLKTAYKLRRSYAMHEDATEKIIYMIEDSLDNEQIMEKILSI